MHIYIKHYLHLTHVHERLAVLIVCMYCMPISLALSPLSQTFLGLSRAIFEMSCHPPKTSEDINKIYDRNAGDFLQNITTWHFSTLG